MEDASLHKLTIHLDLLKSTRKLKDIGCLVIKKTLIDTTQRIPPPESTKDDLNETIILSESTDLTIRILKASLNSSNGETWNEAIQSAFQIEDRRENFLKEFWSSDDRIFDTVQISEYSSGDSSPRKSSQSESPRRMMSVTDFKKDYLHSNKPCIISNISLPITSKWFNTKTGAINTQWFLENVGANTTVPVRINQEGFEDGRAAECKTEPTSMKEWISHKRFDSNYYLKDWHMQSLFPMKLYDSPDIFPDVLNPFLMDVDGGEYMFVYWGFKGSSTSLHSDVLHSCSWSFNVIGRKLWRFYPMEDLTSEDDDDDDDLPVVEVIQEQGHMIFVPSQWRHEVINLEETISVNHNWISACSLDCVWECLVNEIGAIEEELIGWGLDTHSNLSKELNQTRESMLRGCVGMDVSTFCVLLVRIAAECLYIISAGISTTEMNPPKDSSLWDAWFDFSRIVLIVNTIMYDDAKDTDMNDTSEGLHIYLKGRLRSALGESGAQQVLDIMEILSNVGRKVVSESSQ